MTAVEQLPGLSTPTSSASSLPDTDVCFRLSATRDGLTGPPSDKVCTKTAPPRPREPHTDRLLRQQLRRPRQVPRPRLRRPSVHVHPRRPEYRPDHEAELDRGRDRPAQDRSRRSRCPSQGADADRHGTAGEVSRHPLLPTDAARRRDATPPATPTEESFLVFIGPFDTQVDAENQCVTITNATGEACVAAQPDPP